MIALKIFEFINDSSLQSRALESIVDYFKLFSMKKYHNRTVNYQANYFAPWKSGQWCLLLQTLKNAFDVSGRRTSRPTTVALLLAVFSSYSYS